MATTAIWDVTDRLKRVLDYARNPDKTAQDRFEPGNLQQALNYATEDVKTEKQLYVSGVNCDPLTAYEQMQRTKRQYQKTDGIVAFHGYQSFAPGEASPEVAHAIGVKLAQELWGERFEVVVATHLDKGHLHNHFVLNSVSFLDGKRYYDNKASYALMRQTSDRLCRGYKLSVIEHPETGKAKHYGEWQAERENRPTWRGLIREDIDTAIAASMTMTRFFTALQKQGYTLKTNVKHLAVRPPGKERFVRLRSLGDDYTEESLKERILQNRMPKRQPPLPLQRRRRVVKVRGGWRTIRKIKGLQALYLRYLYQMGILPKHRASPKRTHFLLRQDLRHLTLITEQTRLLCRRQISTEDELLAYHGQLQADMKRHYGVRKTLYNRLRRCKQEDQVAVYKTEIAECSRQLAKLRKEVKLCMGILTRSEGMAHLLKEREPERPIREEMDTNERRKRSGRSGRQYEPERNRGHGEDFRRRR
ncbi:relaxase/mobilization nuclease domain-containing protein [Paenibacillus sp. J5C_2022]|uniref:relaxase/mobilization nuclease domain-containing protein n=1 Tax=Paenibacillus sp. J5C2022 TaxID=2977129 RepID=UPI0021D32C6E|nr:relaxase/mobilization nuclease domain-containing protein [Paenibacillus sp. J5C2022]MCU6711508.1 relaxase/mobilization nuclease domain-containing protein [Paenibacillus sp. J5C2022]